MGVAESRDAAWSPRSPRPSQDALKDHESCFFIFVSPQRITRIRIYLQSDLG